MARNPVPVSEMASRLVETVMINVDDFADSFLTCGTCFTGYDSQDRAAKLLPCSHTVCRSCLDRILETQTQSDSFRCPICRETIAIPNGGSAAFPPAFIVNQLLDLIATQRRDVVPKCRIHVNQELLFCETCDVVFCNECRGRSHTSQLPCGTVGSTPLASATVTTTTVLPLDDTNGPRTIGDAPISGPLTSSASGALNHNVISFNVAIKRCTEIMLYKMHLCVQELNNAQDAVTAELNRLEVNKDVCTEAITSRFSEIIALVERRQSELLDEVKRVANDKHRALTDQLSLIESEREAVRRECNNLKGVLDVRTISKAISYLNGKLDTVSALTEPRENAFLRYQDHGQVSSASHPTSRGAQASDSSSKQIAHSSRTATEIDLCTNAISGSTLQDISKCLAAFGRIIVSTTYPALCTARLPQQLVVNLYARAIIRAVDYHGRPQSSGGTDPVEVKLIDSDGHLVPTELLDSGDGSYELILRPTTSGMHQLSVRILSRPIRGSPFQLPVRRAQQRRWCLTEGSDGRGLIQPFAVTVGPYPVDESVSGPEQPRPVYVYLLDTGNSRLLVVDLGTGKVQATLAGEALSGQAATGVAWSPQGLWIVNWRAKRLYLLDPRTDQVIQSIYSSQFVEPTSVFRCPTTGHLFVADNGAGCVFRCNPITGHTSPFVGDGVLTTLKCTPSELNSAELASPSAQFVPQSEQLEDTNDSACAMHQVSVSSRVLPESVPPLESRSWRQISGLCVTQTGELILSTGSTIRIFSRTGKQINCLTPPTAQIGTRSPRYTQLPTRRPASSIPNHDRSTSTTQPSYSLNPAASSTTTTSGMNRASLHMATVTTIGILDGPCPTVGKQASPSHRPVTCSPRGQFGGVCVTGPTPSGTGRAMDNLGVCLLASYSDRKRSGIAVWPQCHWLTSGDSTELNQDSSERYSIPVNNIPIDVESPWFDLNEAPAPYLIEVDPGFRRLAGLLPLSDCRQLVVVDQGAQSLCRIRYA